MRRKIKRARKPMEPTAGKLVIVLSMLRRKKGVTVPQLASAIEWQTRGAWTAISKVRQLGFEVESVKREGGERIYKIAA
jgi:biotin operon repressor